MIFPIPSPLELSMNEELEVLQQKILAGETLSIEEYRRIIEHYRSGRQTAAAMKKNTKSKSPDFDLLAEIDQFLGE